MSQAYRKRVSDLCKKSLEKKWNGDELGEIGDRCPFCYDAWNHYAKLSRNAKINIDGDMRFCSICDCPLSICGDSAKKGFIRKLINKYGENTEVSDLSPEDLAKMQSLFKEWIIE